jgi:hypothetical protein
LPCSIASKIETLNWLINPFVMKGIFEPFNKEFATFKIIFKKN